MLPVRFARWHGGHALNMHAENLEYRFPDGDVELDMTEVVPKVGDVVPKHGRMWKVDRIWRGVPIVVVLQSVPASGKGA